MPRFVALGCISLAPVAVMQVAVCILRADALVLASLNDSWHVPESPDTVDGAEAKIDAISSLALDNADSWSCIPALWQATPRSVFFPHQSYFMTPISFCCAVLRCLSPVACNV
jgi:hypothetical protein